MTLREMERQQIVEALDAEDGRQDRAAQRLGISPRMMCYKIRRLAIPWCRSELDDWTFGPTTAYRPVKTAPPPLGPVDFSIRRYVSWLVDPPSKTLRRA